jgi:hypothetical protein
MKKLLYFTLLISITSLTSCLNAKKLDRYVQQQFPEMQSLQKKKTNETIAISSPLLTNNEKTSTSESKTVGFLPLIVYWRWDYKNACTLNPLIPISNFSKSFTVALNKGLKDKLAGKRIELTIEKIPNLFVIDDIGHSIFLGFYAINWDNVYIKTENKDLVISYKVTNNDASVKSGVIQLAYADDKKRLGLFKSWKTATSEYLSQYDLNISTLAKQAADKLIKEL